jgi:A/G-specific adenine glycosylase
MLQQTTVATVRPRFERFLARWPTVEALAAAADEDVLQEWAGLGYYARARNLIACARLVVEQGGFPRTSAELRQLPGVGSYTAAAVAAIAFGERSAPVDTNVERVIARLRGLERPRREEIEAILLEMLPENRPGDLVQATMDLGATVCRPAKPRCGECPLAVDCAAFSTGAPERFPRRRERSPRPHKHGVAYWIERDGKVRLVRRPPHGLLAGMAALPGGEWQSARPEIEALIGTVRHVFTHFSLDLHVVATSEAGDDDDDDGWWQPLDSLDDAGLPTLYRKAVERALSTA